VTNPLAARYYADQAIHETAPIVEHVQIARDTYRVRVDAPRIARAILPGQFVMLRLTRCDDPLLGRPLALYDVATDSASRPRYVDVVYLVLGKMTRRLATLPIGADLEIWGPLGNGFAPRECSHLIMVAGGIGQTPFLALAKERLGHAQYGDPPRAAPLAANVSLLYGARSRDLLAGLPDFQRAGIDVRTSTDDGSAGHHGLVIDLLPAAIAEPEGRHVVCCGPEPMMEATAKICRVARVSCEVSLETPMACGLGVCFSCVAKVRQDDGDWDYKRTCVDGPVFDAERIEW
jgi:dihydroorotate dehydrogenase electron transfer subunit